MKDVNDSIILRKFSDNDKKEYFDISCSKSVKEYFPYYSENFEEACEIVRIFSKTDLSNNFYFAIEDKNTDLLIGAIIAEKISEQEYNVGYFVGQKYQGKGYATIALKLLIEYLKQRGAKSICFSISRANIASLTVANKINAMKISESDKYEVWRKQI